MLKKLRPSLLACGITLSLLFIIPIHTWAQPANDNCNSAQFVNIPASGKVCISGDASQATDDGLVPATCTLGGNSKDVWYTFVATGPVGQITVTPNGSNPHTNTTVWLASGACNALTIYNCAQVAGSNVATLNWGLTVGTQYYVSVETNGGNGGTFEICFSTTDPPGNPGNNCATAAPICRKSSFSYGNLNGFTPSGVQPACFGSPVQRDIWFKFTVGVTGTLEFMASPKQAQEFDWAVYDITNGCLGNLVSCNYYFSQPLTGSEANPIGMKAVVPPGLDAGEFNAPITVTAGRTYAILIDNYSGQNGGFDFEWGGTFQMAPAADFTLNPPTGCNSVTTAFTNNSKGATTQIWSFGDGTSSTAQNPPPKTYSNPGNYVVSLVVTDATTGCKSAVSQLVTVSKPKVSIVPSPDTICTGSSSTLNGTVTTTTLQSPVQYYRSLNVSLTDNNATGFSSIISVSGIYPAIVSANTIESVCLDIDHTRAQDVDIYLIAPNGTQIELSTDNGANGANYIQTCFRPNATVAITAGAAPFTGNYLPEQNFNLLNGSNVNGNWTLRVADDQSGQLGTFNEWSISFKNQNSFTYAWSPTSNMSGAGTLSPSVSPTNNSTTPLSVPYTLTATDALGCTADTTVNVVIIKSDAGPDGTIKFCETGAPVDLKTAISGAPIGGRWENPNNAPFTNPYNPAIHQPGNYAYMVGTKGCPEDTAIVVVSEIAPPNAGTDGLDTLCNNGNINLFNVISNEPSGGTWKGPGSVNQSSGALNGSNLSPGLYKFDYIVAGTSPCPSDTAVANIFIKTLPTASLGPSNPVCQENTAYLKPIFTGLAPFTVTYTNCSGQSFTATNLKPGDSIAVSLPTPSCVFTITSVTDGGNYPCTQVQNNSRTLTALAPPTIAIDSIACNATNTAYRVYLTLAGGDQATYQINGSSSGVTGKKYISSFINGGSSYSFVLSDKNGCNPKSSVSGIKNCDCATNAGSMQASALSVCGSDSAFGVHLNDETLDPNDRLNYILHDQSGASMGKVYAINTQNPHFAYNASWGINYDQTYYISAIAGDAIGNTVDTTNPNGCLSVAQGQPVAFHQIPQLAASVNPSLVCQGSNSSVILNLSAGRAPFNVDYTDPLGANTNSGNLASAADQFAITPPNLGQNTYTLNRVTDQFGCVRNISIPLQVRAVDSPDTSATSIVCNNTNTAYTVSFTIINGEASSYTVNGLSVSGNNFNSSFIPSGQAYNFVVNDQYNCKPLSIQGLHTCPCISDPGTMSAGPSAPPMEVCINSWATSGHQGDQVLDGNDVLSFILCTDPTNPIGTLVQHNDSASFGFVGGMTPYSVYYICPVAGDQAANGLADLSASCLKTSQGTPLRFIPLPTAAFSGSTHICQGGSATIQLTVNGNAPINFDLVGTDGSRNSISGSGTFPFTLSPSISSGIIEYRIDTNGTNGVYDNTVGGSCRGSWISAPIQIYVHPTPTASISGNFTICLGESIKLPIVMTGDSVLRGNYGSGTFSSFVLGRAGSFSPLVTPPSAGNFTYTLTSVTDNTPAQCVGTVSGSAQITVRALPTASMSIIDPQVCRGESSGPQFVIAGQPNLSIFYRDQTGNTFSQTGLAPGTYSYPFVPAISTTFFLDSILDGTLSDATNKACKTTYLNQSAFVDVRPLPIGVLSGDTGICRGESTSLRFDLSQSAPDAAPFSLVYQKKPSMGGSAMADSLSGLPLNSSIIVQPNDSTLYEPLRLYDRFGCRSINFSGRAQVDVYPIPLPVMAASDTASCMPLLTQLINLTDPSFTGTYTWDFGDGTSYKGSGQSQPIAHTYAQPGSYSVRLTVKSAQGCMKDSLIYNFLRAHPYPVAQFSYSPTVPNILEPELRFSNLSTLNYSNQWTFSTGLGAILGSSSLAQPSFRFPDEDSGTYSVKLRVESAFGCADSTKQQIFINGITESFIPSAFSPNGDGINEVFRPIHVGERPLQYEFSVFNRWGERIFYTTNPKEGWDGSYQGELAKPDVYTYSIHVVSKYSSSRKQYSGKVSLLR